MHILLLDMTDSKLRCSIDCIEQLDNISLEDVLLGAHVPFGVFRESVGCAVYPTLPLRNCPSMECHV